VRSIGGHRSRIGFADKQGGRSLFVLGAPVLLSTILVLTLHLPFADASGGHRVRSPEHTRPLDRAIKVVWILDQHGTLMGPPAGSYGDICRGPRARVPRVELQELDGLCI
jgi:hypothetical protein